MSRQVFVVLTLCLWGSPSLAADSYGGIDPYWMLLHEPAVIAELHLSPAQSATYRQALDPLDRQFFPLRNKPAQEGRSGLEKLVAAARQQLAKILRPEQLARLEEIHLRRLGTAALQREDFAARLKLSVPQRQEIGKILDEVRGEVAELEKQAGGGKPREPLEKEFAELKTEEQKRLLALLKPEQQKAWKDALGKPFDLARIGQPAMKAPEIVDCGEWINAARPPRMADLSGKVVVVHFYAADCINCIRNYPTYREWQERFKGREVVILGIHTPETSAERDVAAVRQKAAQEKFAFPICIDGKNQNWNAWGNSLWPSVYLVDKRGYVRAHWPGELKWQGATGDVLMAKRIEALLAEEP